MSLIETYEELLELNERYSHYGSSVSQVSIDTICPFKTGDIVVLTNAEIINGYKPWAKDKIGIPIEITRVLKNTQATETYVKMEVPKVSVTGSKEPVYISSCVDSYWARFRKIIDVSER